ncbi:MAG: hypothetical protein ACREVN_09890 [Gammaproteobacteria bacterium]
MSTQRELLPENDLLDWMNGRLQREPRYRRCQFNAIELLGAGESDEGNWITAHLHCDAAPDKECMDAANAIIDEAKARFDVSQSRARGED